MARGAGTGAAAALDEVCRAIVCDGREVVRVDGEVALALPVFLREHGLSAIAGAWVEEGRLVLPDGVATAVREDAQAWAAWVGAVDAECERLGEAARAHRDRLSPPVLLKGAAVARRYERPEYRPYEDTDLLVPIDELEAWADVLASVGYTTSSGPRPLPWQHAVTYTRPALVGPMGPMECDLHVCMAVERHARAFGYGPVAEHAEESPFPGLLWPSRACVLLLLSVHLLRHPPPARKWVWARDLLELADPATLAAALALAARYDLGWALEHALSTVPSCSRPGPWPIGPSVLRPPWSLAGVYQRGFPGYLFVLALEREMGARVALRFVARKVAPGTFVSPQGFDPGFAARRMGRLARRAGRTFRGAAKLR